MEHPSLANGCNCVTETFCARAQTVKPPSTPSAEEKPPTLWNLCIGFRSSLNRAGVGKQTLRLLKSLLLFWAGVLHSKPGGQSDKLRVPGCSQAQAAPFTERALIYEKIVVCDERRRDVTEGDCDRTRT